MGTADILCSVTREKAAKSQSKELHYFGNFTATHLDQNDMPSVSREHSENLSPRGNNLCLPLAFTSAPRTLPFLSCLQSVRRCNLGFIFAFNYCKLNISTEAAVVSLFLKF